MTFSDVECDGVVFEEASNVFITHLSENPKTKNIIDVHEVLVFGIT